MATKYFTHDENQLMDELQPIIGRMDHDEANNLCNFMQALDTVVYQIKNLSGELEDFQNNYKPEVLKKMCDALSVEDSRILSDFLTKMLTNMEDIGNALWSIVKYKDVYGELEEAASERWYAPKIPVRISETAHEGQMCGEEARDFISEYGHDVQKIDLNNKGRIRVTLSDGSTVEHNRDDATGTLILDFVGYLEKVVEKD